MVNLVVKRIDRKLRNLDLLREFVLFPALLCRCKSAEENFVTGLTQPDLSLTESNRCSFDFH